MTQAKRLIFRSDRNVEIESFEIPDPGPHEVLVRVQKSQVSAGSEMNFFRHNPIDGPLVKAQLGYMTVGEVIAVGSAVAGYQAGDRVLTSGFHQSHWIVDLNPLSEATPAARYIQKLDDAIKSEQAGFVILGDVSLHGLRRVQPQIDESAAIIGCGIVGQLAIQLARIAGMYPIIAIDLVESRLEKARLSGATHLVNSAKVDPVAAVMEITGGVGAQSVFPCAPVPSTIQTSMEMAAKRGKISLVASIPGTAEIGLQVELMRRELSIIGTYEVDIDEPIAYWPWSRSRNRQACLRLLKSGELKLDHLISHVVHYTEAEAMFAAMHDGVTDWMGVVFDWTQI
jgi:2-desacetyl-2-hydroxyethyl bacteriochlorophyllide A dehydrogenase